MVSVFCVKHETFWAKLTAEVGADRPASVGNGTEEGGDAGEDDRGAHIERVGEQR